MKQIIMVVLDLQENKPYEPTTSTGYEELNHFFTDLGFTVEKISTGVEKIAEVGISFLYEDQSLLDWCSGVRSKSAGSFLSNIVGAAFNADCDNLRHLYPLLKELQAKYPKYNQQ